MIKAVAFDVGETLLNESRSWRLWAEWLKIPEHAFFAVLGATIERGDHHHRVFEMLKPGFVLDAARQERERAGTPDAFVAADLYPDVPACLAALRERGVRIGIAGNQPVGFERVIRDADLAVDFIGSSAAWNIEKPAPAFFKRVIEACECRAESIAYVGDRLDNDVIPALNAGMNGVFLKRGPWGFIHAQRPDTSRASLVLNNLTELPSAIQSL